MTNQSIHVGLYAEINGQQQWLTIRSQNRDNPVLFIISGPGGALSAMTPLFEPWEQSFTIVQWDQPGAGSTFALNGDGGVEPFTLDRLTKDAAAVAQFVCLYLGIQKSGIQKSGIQKSGIQKLVLLGLSGGSIIGLKLAQARPDLVGAYVGCGQIVNWPRQQHLSYQLLLERARMRDDKEAVTELESIGPPPWLDMDHEVAIAKYQHEPTQDESKAMADPEFQSAMQPPPPGEDYIAKGVTLGDQRPQATRMYARLREEYSKFNAWQLGTNFKVPLFFFQGDHDVMTPTPEVERYCGDIHSPHAEVVNINGSGHAGFYLRDQFLQLLLDNVLVYLNRSTD